MNKAILQIIKRFLPQIQQSALPAITNVLEQVVADVELQDGEDNACVMISMYEGEWWAYIVAMSPNNAVTRIVKNMRLNELLSVGLSMIDKEC